MSGGKRTASGGEGQSLRAALPLARPRSPVLALLRPLSHTQHIYIAWRVCGWVWPASQQAAWQQISRRPPRREGRSRSRQPASTRRRCVSPHLAPATHRQRVGHHGGRRRGVEQRAGGEGTRGRNRRKRPTKSEAQKKTLLSLFSRSVGKNHPPHTRSWIVDTHSTRLNDTQRMGKKGETKMKKRRKRTLPLITPPSSLCRAPPPAASPPAPPPGSPAWPPRRRGGLCPRCRRPCL